MTTRVPFTRANLQFYTGLERAKLERKLDALVRGGVLDLDSDDAGEPVWSVVGADRPARGPTQIADVVGLEQLKGESHALAPLTKRGGGSFLPALVRGDGSKSILASGALSFFFGPLGWLYAAQGRAARGRHLHRHRDAAAALSARAAPRRARAGERARGRALRLALQPARRAHVAAPAQRAYALAPAPPQIAAQRIRPGGYGNGSIAI
jgi:hypothetical protein